MLRLAGCSVSSECPLVGGSTTAGTVPPQVLSLALSLALALAGRGGGSVMEGSLALALAPSLASSSSTDIDKLVGRRGT